MINQILQDKMQITINVEVFIVKEDKYFVAYCPALELSAYGNSKDKALESFDKEVKIFLDETQKRGSLEKYLLKNGWRLQQNPNAIYEPPRSSADKLFGLIKSGESSLHKQTVNIPV